MSQVLAMSEKIQDLERTVEDLKQRLCSPVGTINSLGLDWSQNMHHLAWTADLTVEAISDVKTGGSDRTSPGHASTTDPIGMLAELSLDENGEVCIPSIRES